MHGSKFFIWAKSAMHLVAEPVPYLCCHLSALGKVSAYVYVSPMMRRRMHSPAGALISATRDAHAMAQRTSLNKARAPLQRMLVTYSGNLTPVNSTCCLRAAAKSERHGSDLAHPCEACMHLAMEELPPSKQRIEAPVDCGTGNALLARISRRDRLFPRQSPEVVSSGSRAAGCLPSQSVLLRLECPYFCEICRRLPVQRIALQNAP